jgi:hypothetical protein
VIHTIDELVVLTQRQADVTEAEGYPEVANEIRLRTPGCSDEEIARLRAALPGLSESYLAIAARVALPIVAIGFLQLAPGGLHDGSLFDRLTDVNSTAWPLWAFVDEHNLYHVADTDGSLFCVVREDAKHPGEVYRVDYEWGGIDNPQLHRVAWSFEQLLLGFGRISEQAQAGRFGPHAVTEVLDSMREDFGLDEEQLQDWSWTVEEALSEA